MQGGVARRMLRVGHYLNQFFAGIGAEEHANHAPERREGAVGPGRALQTLLKEDGRVVSTLVCGDNFFNERADAAHAAVRAWLEATGPTSSWRDPRSPRADTGAPAPRCAGWPRTPASRRSPGCTRRTRRFLLYPKAYVVPTGNSAAEMGRALGAMLPLVRKLGGRSALGPAARRAICRAGCGGRGCAEASGAERAVSMLVAQARGPAVPDRDPGRRLRCRAARAADPATSGARRSPW